MEEKSIPPHKLASQLSDMNMEIQYLLNKFSIFRETRVVDGTLCRNISKLVENLETYMDSEPTVLPTSHLSDFQIDFNQHNIQRVFYCKLCEVNIRGGVFAINRHLKTSKHHLEMMKCVASVPQDAKKNVGNDLKHDVASIEVSLKKQLKKERRKEEKESKKKIPDRNELPKKMAAFVHSNFYNYLVDSSNMAKKIIQIPAYDDLRQILTKTIGQVYPNVRIYFFGSRINGLANVDSDLDIYIDVGDNYNNPIKGEEGSKHIKVVRKLLEGDMREWKCFNAILSARIPILRVYNQKYRIDCDLNFTNSLGECNTLLIKYYLELQPVCQKLCLFVKRWIKISSFGENFSTYTLVLMIIFHLQQKRFLPSVRALQIDIDANLVGPWQCNFSKPQLCNLAMDLIPDTPNSVLKLLISFFTFCAEFDYKNFIICPYTGTPIERKSLHTLNKTFPRYDHFREKCSVKDLFQLEKPMCIQDPLELNHNIAKGVVAKILALFCQFSRLTAAELNARLKASS